MCIYDKSGAVIVPTIYDDFANNFHMWQGRNVETGTNYIVLRIFKQKADGTKQFPFVYAPTGTGVASMSTLQMNMRDKFPLAINAGIFDTTTNKPKGTIIQNGVLLQQGDDIGRDDRLVITIDNNGDLGYALSDASGATMIANGIVSAVLSFIPIVINYKNAGETISSSYLTNDADAQRQIFGQFGNGDYCVITSEARGFQASTGFTIPQAIDLCLSLGLKFAFNLDGGGSTETVIGRKQINTIYEGTYGRIVPTYIVFNGSTTFPDM